jgi:hypothetical protein
MIYGHFRSRRHLIELPLSSAAPAARRPGPGGRKRALSRPSRTGRPMTTWPILVSALNKLPVPAVKLRRLAPSFPSKRRRPAGHQMIEFGQEDDAFLLVRVCAGDNCQAGFGRAEIVGQMWHAGRDV